MKRLTEKDESPCICCAGIGSCRTDCSYKQIYDRLAEYEDAEEQGLLVRLPCKVGDTVYRVTAIEGCEQCKHYDGITNVDDWECFAGKCPQRIVECKFKLGDLRLIEKTVFLTREAAEKALEDA